MPASYPVGVTLVALLSLTLALSIPDARRALTVLSTPADHSGGGVPPVVASPRRVLFSSHGEKKPTPRGHWGWSPRSRHRDQTPADDAVMRDVFGWKMPGEPTRGADEVKASEKPPERVDTEEPGRTSPSPSSTGAGLHGTGDDTREDTRDDTREDTDEVEGPETGSGTDGSYANRTYPPVGDVVAPKFLLYMYGHLRTFHLLSRRHLKQWDDFAEGGDYLVFIHTWDELDHNEQVWYKAPGENDVRSFPISPADIVSNPSLNALLPRVAGWKIDTHPGRRAIAEAYGVDEEWEKTVCAPPMSCVSDALAQIDELKRTHELALTHVREARLRKRIPGGDEALRKLPVVRTRPDVTMRTRCGDTCDRPEDITFDHVGAPDDGVSSLVGKLEEGGHRKVMAGYRGPWHGGWTDITFASTFGVIDDLVGKSSNLSALVDHVRVPPVPNLYANKELSEGMNEKHGEVVKDWREGKFKAEMVWLTILTREGIAATFFQFCAVMRWRVGLRSVRGRDEIYFREMMPHMC